MTCRILIAGLTAAALAVGCSERDAPTALNDVPVKPAMDFTNGPDNPGNSGVFRIQGAWLIGTTDPERDLLAYHFQSDDWLGCGGSSGITLYDIQLVYRPQEVEEAFDALAKAGDIPVLIYRLSDVPPFGPEFCEFLQNWLYKGTHSIVINTNDYTLEAPGAKSTGWSAHGFVYDPDGREHRYSENQRVVYGPDDEFRGAKVEKILVVPTGGD